jgi:class 3 adenylate cyclase
MTLPEIVGVIAGVLTIAGVLVAATRYITQLQYQVRIERLQTQKESGAKAQSDLAAMNSLLVEELSAARRTGAVAAAKKGEVDDALTSIMKLTGAGGGSIYVPLPTNPGQETEGLVFLSIQPVTQQTMKLRRKTIPIHSLAGRCFTKGEPFVVANSKASSDHYGKADAVSGYQTHDTINLPLRGPGGVVVGVLQLLNREGARFAERDIAELTQLSATMAARVAEFLSISGSLEILGIVPQPEADYATVMFCDLTASSTLFSELNVSSAVQHLNEYLERACDIAFARGATVDKYVGDGVLLRFNVPRSVPNHPMEAVQAAFEISDAFARMKSEWITLGEVLGRVYVRSGIAYGPVQLANVGHPQYQYLTIFGTPVNAAVNLCDIAARNRNVVVVDEFVFQHVKDMVDAERLPDTGLGKASKHTGAAYEIRPRGPMARPA